MISKRKSFLGLFATTLAFGSPAFAELQLLISRTENTVEIYWSTPADQLEPVFGLPNDWLLNNEGAVEFAPLREGTFLQADKVFADIDVKVGAEPFLFEAMSMMVHPATEALPFTNPLEALISIEVCNVDDPTVPLTSSDLQAYAGFFAYDVDGMERLSLHFPETGRSEMEMTVLDFYNGHLVGEKSVLVGDGQGVSIAQVDQSLLPNEGGIWAKVAALFN